MKLLWPLLVVIAMAGAARGQSPTVPRVPLHYQGPSINARGYSSGYVPRTYTYYGPKYVPPSTTAGKQTFGPQGGGYYYSRPLSRPGSTSITASPGRYSLGRTR